jgi:hypothetical protein
MEVIPEVKGREKDDWFIYSFFPFLPGYGFDFSYESMSCWVATLHG